MFGQDQKTGTSAADHRKSGQDHHKKYTLRLSQQIVEKLRESTILQSEQAEKILISLDGNDVASDAKGSEAKKKEVIEIEKTLADQIEQAVKTIFSELSKPQIRLGVCMMASLDALQKITQALQILQSSQKSIGADDQFPIIGYFLNKLHHEGIDINVLYARLNYLGYLEPYFSNGMSNELVASFLGFISNKIFLLKKLVDTKNEKSLVPVEQRLKQLIVKLNFNDAEILDGVNIGNRKKLRQKFHDAFSGTDIDAEEAALDKIYIEWMNYHAVHEIAVVVWPELRDKISGFLANPEKFVLPGDNINLVRNLLLQAIKGELSPLRLINSLQTLDENKVERELLIKIQRAVAKNPFQILSYQADQNFFQQLQKEAKQKIPQSDIVLQGFEEYLRDRPDHISSVADVEFSNNLYKHAKLGLAEGQQKLSEFYKKVSICQAAQQKYNKDYGKHGFFSLLRKIIPTGLPSFWKSWSEKKIAASNLDRFKRNIRKEINEAKTQAENHIEVAEFLGGDNKDRLLNFKPGIAGGAELNTSPKTPPVDKSLNLTKTDYLFTLLRRKIARDAWQEKLTPVHHAKIESDSDKTTSEPPAMPSLHT